VLCSHLAASQTWPRIADWPWEALADTHRLGARLLGRCLTYYLQC
jgi:hypothetical protein